MNKTARILLGILLVSIPLLKLIGTVSPLPSQNQPAIIQSALIWYWQDIKKVNHIIAPKLTELYTPIPLPFKLDLNRLPNANTYQSNIQYTPQNNLPIVYFDNDGKLSDKPVPNGYYRKILGKDNNNQWVIQDYYQDTNTPQISIAKLKQNSDYKNFDGNLTDGSIAFFDKNGELTELAFINHTHNNTMVLKNKQIIAQVIVDINNNNTATILLLNQNQQPKAIIKPIADANKLDSYFLYPNQNKVFTFVQIDTNNPQNSRRLSFTEQGYPIKEPSKAQLDMIDAMGKEVGELLAYLQKS